MSAAPQTMYERNPVTNHYLDDRATDDERTYALFTHLCGLLSLLDHFILGLIGVVIMWRIKNEESPFLDDHGREATNFLLSMLVYQIALVAFAAITFGFGVIVTVPGFIALWVVRLIFGIKGAMAAQRGEFYRYPITIRFFA
ncbi:MAG: DUF4870 domain-containing protein [Planctomycetota bacterium]|nr:DUF4870 domain-containing protein [Planctomycetota bacterium]